MPKIITKIEDGIALLKIDRPEALNALSREIIDEIDAFIESITENKSVKVLLIYSENNFAAGADIKNMIECNEEEAKAFAFSPTYDKIEYLAIPTIAAIEGYALGGGLELALTCDLRIAASNAKMGFPEINLGIMPGAGGTIRAPKLIGAARAKEMIFTGDVIDAEKALAIGLVNQIVAKDEVFPVAIKLAEKLARKAPIAMSVAKETITAGLEETSVPVAVAIELENWAGLFNTLDQKEGMKAFIEKRKPLYQGK
jgi:enoyl-CoA hydratase/carnithine racemase